MPLPKNQSSRRKKVAFDAGVVATVLALLVGIGLTLQFRRFTTQIDKPGFHFIPPPPKIELFTFGYKDTVADLLWLRLLPDIGVCEREPDGMGRRETDTPDTPPRCRFNYVYQMVNAVTTLAPTWKAPHMSGALMLSVVVNDRDGATEIFNRTIERFPDDWNVFFRAGYHAIWETKDEAKAADLLVRAAKLGAPPWTYSLAAKLYSKSGKAMVAKSVLESALKENREGPGKDRLKKRLAEIELELGQELAKEKAKEKAK